VSSIVARIAGQNAVVIIRVALCIAQGLLATGRAAFEIGMKRSLVVEGVGTVMGGLLSQTEIDLDPLPRMVELLISNFVDG